MYSTVVPTQEYIRKDKRKELLYYVNLIRACMNFNHHLIYKGDFLTARTFSLSKESLWCPILIFLKLLYFVMKCFFQIHFGSWYSLQFTVGCAMWKKLTQFTVSNKPQTSCSLACVVIITLWFLESLPYSKHREDHDLSEKFIETREGTCKKGWQTIWHPPLL